MFSALVFIQQHQPVVRDRDRLAVVARLYKQGKAKSRFELYLDGQYGGVRRLLPMPVEPFRAVWVSSSELVVQTDRGWYFGNKDKWKPKLIKETGDFNLVESRNRTWKPSEPEFFVDEQPGYFVFDKKSLKFKEQTGSSAHDVKLAESGRTTIEEPNGGKLEVEPFQYFSYKVSGKEVEAENEFQRAWRDKDRLWVLAGTHSSGSGSVNSILLFEKGKEPRVVIPEANCMDMHESRPYFAYCTPRTTSPLNPKDPSSIQVWSSELVVGDWTYSTGVRRTVYGGAIHVASVSIRP